MEDDLSALVSDAGSPGHRTLAEKAFLTLQSAIISGRLRPGTRLPIEDLAAALHMSPMPIREALRRLDAAGLVENVPHRGARVTQLSITDLAEVYEARLTLETLAIRRAAARFTTTHAEAAAQAIDALHELPDDASDRTTDAHLTFHFTLYDAADSAWLLRLILPAWETSERYCQRVPSSRRLAERVGEHRDLLAACTDHDPERAALALNDHLATTANSIALELGVDEPLFALGQTATSPIARIVSPAPGRGGDLAAPPAAWETEPLGAILQDPTGGAD